MITCTISDLKYVVVFKIVPVLIWLCESHVAKRCSPGFQLFNVHSISSLAEDTP